MGFFKKKPGAKGIRPKTSRVKVYVHGRSVLCCGCRLLRRSDQTPGSDDNEKLGGRLSIATHKNADRAITDGDQMKEAFLYLWGDEEVLEGSLSSPELWDAGTRSSSLGGLHVLKHNLFG